MAPLTIANYLGQLQHDPDDQSVFEALREAVTSGDPEILGDNPIRLLEVARTQHEQRGELRAAAWLIEVEAPLIQGDPDLEVALLKELGRLRHEELLDDSGANEVLRRALELRPDDGDVRDTLDQVEQAASNWQQIAQRFVEEAEHASDSSLRTSLLARAASLVWQYKKRGKEKEVDRLFRAALDADPAATQAARLYAETLRIRGQWDALATVLRDAADHAHNRDEKLQLYLRASGTFARRLGREEDAAACYERVLDFAPGHEEALGYLVDYFTEREEWDHLVALYEDALRARQKLESEQGILLQLAMVHWKVRQRPADAEPYFTRLRKIDPAHPGVLAFYRENLGESDEDSQRLLTVLGDALRVADADQKPALAIELARAAHASDTTAERAIDAWKAVQRFDPSNQEARTSLRELYGRAGKWNALVELLKQEVEALGPDEVDERVAILREMVPIYRDELELDVMVINTYNAILHHEPRDREAMHALAATYEGMGRWNDLIQVLAKQAESETNPEKKVATLMRIASLWTDRFANYNQATRPLEEVVAIEPGNREALERLHAIYEKKRAWSSLFDVLRREIDLEPDGALRLDRTVELARLAGDRLHRHGEAIRLWKEVVAERPDEPGALDSLEKLAEREKEWPTLADVLELRLKQTEEPRRRTKILQKLGGVYGDHLQDPASAATAWKRILEIDPKNGRATRTLREAFLAAEDWAGLEALYADAGDWEGLVEVLGTAAEKASDPELKVQLSFRAAEVYEEEIGEPHRAFRNYERVLAVHPADVRASRALVPIYEKDEKWTRLVGLKETLLSALNADAPTEERLGLIEELRSLSLERIRDEAAAFRWATEAYRLAPDSADVIARLEETADAARAFDKLFELYEGRLEVAEDREEQLRLRRSLASIAGERLGRSEEAVVQLEAILTQHPTDLEALDVLDRIYRKERRGADLRRLLLHRIEHSTDSDERFMQLAELAHLEEEFLGDPGAALARYEAMSTLDPSSDEVLQALDRLYSAALAGELPRRASDPEDQAEPFEERPTAEMSDPSSRLADVLLRRREATSDDAEYLSFTLRLASLYQQHLHNPRSALAAFAEVLERQPGTEQAVQGLEALERDHPDLSLEVGRLLEDAYEVRSSDEKLAGVLEKRLEASSDVDERRDLLLRLAALRGSLGDLERAYDAVERAYSESPTDVELWDRLADAAEASGRLEALSQAYARVLNDVELSGRDASDLAARTARIFDEALARPEDAEPFHQRVLVEDPLVDRSFEALKELYTTQERWDELQQLYRHRIAQTVDAEAKLELLLQVCFLFEELLDEPDDAIRAYEEVIDLDPTHVPARRSLERLFRRTERWRDLVVLLRQNLDGAEGQDRLELTLELAQLHEEQLSEPTLAVDYYEQVLAENPNHLRAQEALERLIAEPSQRQRIAAVLEPLYQEQGAYPELTRILSVQLEDIADPSARVDVLVRIAELHEQKLHDLDAAFRSLSDAVLTDPENGPVRAELGRLAGQRQNGQVERAEVLEKASGRAREAYLKAELLLEIARLWDEEESNFDKAEDAYRRLIAADADNPDVVLPASRALEQIHLAREDHPALVEDLRCQIGFESDPLVQRELLVRLATLFEEVLGDLDQAVAVHEQRLEFDPSDDDALRSLEGLFERQQAWRRLISVLERREELTLDAGEQREIAKRIGSIYEERLADHDNAVAAYHDVLSRFGPDRETLVALARLYHTMERWTELLEVVQLAYEHIEDPVERSDLRFNAAELMRTRTGDIDGAIEAYSEVLAVAPDHEASLAALGEVMRGASGPQSIAAARVLAPRFEGGGDYEQLLAVLDVLSRSDEPGESVRSLRRAAEVADVGLGDSARAFALMGAATRASLSEPNIEEMIRELDRLAEASGTWQEHVGLLRDIEGELYDGELQSAIRLKIADLAQSRLTDLDVAQEYYRRVLDDQPDHEGALDALEHLYDERADTAGLLSILRRKIDLAENADTRIELLHRAAELSEKQAADVEGAIDAYERILAEAEHEAAYEGLERLYTSGAHWSELASLLERRLEHRVGDPVSVHYRLGRVYERELSDVSRSVDEYRAALEANGDHQPTIERLSELMTQEDTSAVAAEILEPVFTRRMDWPRVIAALEARLLAEGDLDSRRTLLRRMGTIYEDYLEDLAGALEVYARLFREDPTDQDVWDTLARLARNQDAHDRLAEVYDEALSAVGVDDPVTVALAFQTGVLFDERVGDADKAAAYYQRVLSFDPVHEKAFLALEALYRRNDRHEPLFDLYRRQVDVADADAERVDLLHKAAAVRRGPLADPEAAIDLYREILEIDPIDATATRALEELLTEQERWADLAEHLRRRIEQQPGTPEEVELRHRLGEVLWQRLDDEVGAVDVFEEVTQMSPQHGPTVEALERLITARGLESRVAQILEPIYRETDEWQKTVSILEVRIEHSDDRSDKVAMLGEIARLHEGRGGDGAKAFGAWKRAFVEDPHDEEVRSHLDRLAAQLECWDAQVQAYEEATRAAEDPDVVTRLLSTVARVHDEHRGDPRSAIETYERLLVHDPDDPTPLDSLDALHTMVGDWRGLVEVLQRKTERTYDSPARAELWRRAGSVLEELLSDRGAAIDAYQKASDEDPDDAISLEALDRLFSQAGESVQLAHVLQRRIELETDEALRAELGLRVAALYETQLNEPDRAVEAYQRVLDDQPNHPAATVRVGRLYERQGMWAELLDNLRVRADLVDDPKERLGLVHRAGEVLERELDDVHEALGLFQEALDIDPAYEPAIAALLRIANLEDYRIRAAEIVEPRLSELGRWDDLAALLQQKAEGATDPYERRVEFRRLAEIQERGRGDLNLAFDSLSRALAEDPSHTETADELERVAASNGSWSALADVLNARASSVLDPVEARSLYVRLARVAEKHLGDDALAIKAHTRAVEQVGDDEELLSALDRLYVKTEDYVALGEVLERLVHITAEPNDRNDLLVRLGGLREQHYSDLRGAFDAYQQVLEQDPGNAIALSSMERLLNEDALAMDVVEDPRQRLPRDGSYGKRRASIRGADSPCRYPGRKGSVPSGVCAPLRA